ncbi:hypothetical protein REISMN_01405 [Rickettsia tamurae subsp. buchneri]|uniref:Uncharacterized protein n=1 Tax=Rickettsia tamurae subsp. buchneri TaxID=1462938 RepID=A0A8E0WMZ2_9RICK|nr:hypothetical protein REISMN_01405 [Rickettsia tamurae subsp. buchneri]
MTILLYTYYGSLRDPVVIFSSTDVIPAERLACIPNHHCKRLKGAWQSHKAGLLRLRTYKTYSFSVAYDEESIHAAKPRMKLSSLLIFLFNFLFCFQLLINNQPCNYIISTSKLIIFFV